MSAAADGGRVERSSNGRMAAGLVEAGDAPAAVPVQPWPAAPGRRGSGGLLLLVPGLGAVLAVLVLQTTSIAQAVVVAVPVGLVGLGLERLGRGGGVRGLRPLGVLVLLLALTGPALVASSPPGSVERVTLRSAVPPAAEDAVLHAAMGAGQLRLKAGGPGLLEADLRSSGRPVTAVATSGGSALVDLRSPAAQGLLARNRGSDWTAALTPSLPWRIELESGPVTADLDLSQVNLRALRVSGDAPSRVALRLGMPTARTQVDVHLAAGVLDVYVPAGAGLELHLSGAVLRNVGGLARDGGIWRAPGDHGRAYVLVAGVGVGAVRIHRG